MANPCITDCLASAVIRHACLMQCTFPLDFAVVFFEILRCRNFLIVGFGWQFIRHRLFLRIFCITFPSLSLPFFSVLCSGSFPSCPYLPLSRLLFQPHTVSGCLLLSSLLPAGPHNYILSLFWLFFSSVKITIFLFLWKFQLSPLLTSPNLLSASQVFIPCFFPSASLT